MTAAHLEPFTLSRSRAFFMPARVARRKPLSRSSGSRASSSLACRAAGRARPGRFMLAGVGDVRGEKLAMVFVAENGDERQWLGGEILCLWCFSVFGLPFRGVQGGVEIGVFEGRDELRFGERSE